MTPVIQQLHAIFEQAFGVADRVEDLVRRQLAGERRRTADLAGMRDVVAPCFASPGQRAAGAGFVAATGVLEDSPWWLEWYVRGDDDAVERLQVPLDPSQHGFYDYTTTAWFREPEQHRHRVVTGPYVDYLCTEDQTLTFSQPVVVGDRFLGVAACDVPAVTVERDLVPTLRRLDQLTIVANPEGRVLCSNSGRFVCGDLLSAADLAEATPVPGLAMVVASPSP